MHYKVMALDDLDYRGNGFSQTSFDVGTGAYAGIRDANSSGDVNSPARVSGKANREILGRWIADPSANTTGKAIDEFSSFKRCDDMGEGWCLPAVNELQHISCIYNGGDPTTWATGKSPYGFNSSATSEFRKLFEAAGGSGFDSDYYHSSTEYGSDKAWVVQVYEGETVFKTKNGYFGRCIKEIN